MQGKIILILLVIVFYSLAFTLFFDSKRCYKYRNYSGAVMSLIFMALFFAVGSIALFFLVN